MQISEIPAQRKFISELACGFLSFLRRASLINTYRLTKKNFATHLNAHKPRKPVILSID